MNQVELTTRRGIEVAPTLAYLAAHEIPGAERHDPEGRRHSRLMPTAAGPRAVTVTLDTDRVLLETDAGPGEVDEIAGLVRSWLDLDADLAAVEAALAPDPVVGPMVRARPGLRVIGCPDGFEGAVMTVLGQQVSLAAARTFGGRLVAAYGEPGPDGLTRFPRPERIGGLDPEDLRETVRITGARARTIHRVAAAFGEGLELHPGVDRDEARERLLDVPGVGPWTVDYLAVRALRDPDAFPAGDLGVRKVLGGITAPEASERSEAWRPWRSYALFHIWTVGAFLGADDLGGSGHGAAGD